MMLQQGLLLQLKNSFQKSLVPNFFGLWPFIAKQCIIVSPCHRLHVYGKRALQAKVDDPFPTYCLFQCFLESLRGKTFQYFTRNKQTFEKRPKAYESKHDFSHLAEIVKTTNIQDTYILQDSAVFLHFVTSRIKKFKSKYIMEKYFAKSWLEVRLRSPFSNRTRPLLTSDTEVM